jgi:hypothetical protein
VYMGQEGHATSIYSRSGYVTEVGKVGHIVGTSARSSCLFRDVPDMNLS